jgi:ATP-dependent 26S proteasome regulatory subunit
VLDQEELKIYVSFYIKKVETARKNAPCIIFIDEFDSLASKRSAKDPAYASKIKKIIL